MLEVRVLPPEPLREIDEMRHPDPNTAAVAYLHSLTPRISQILGTDQPVSTVAAIGEHRVSLLLARAFGELTHVEFLVPGAGEGLSLTPGQAFDLLAGSSIVGHGVILIGQTTNDGDLPMDKEPPHIWGGSLEATLQV